jgi:ligand-binding sensor domain-containing protein/class 3 adenylate cyclase/predicted metal-dependent HD superfamily phosphohydrolase
MKYIIFFFFILFQLIESFSQTVQFNKLSIKEGLSQSSILTLIQDDKGFIWAGTQDGLNRYDGYDFKVFKHRIDNKNSLSNSFINTIKQDPKSLLFWIGTENGGLNRYDPRSGDFFSFPKEHPLSKIDIQQLEIDKNGSVWFTTQNNGLYHYWPSNDKIEIYNQSNGKLPSNKLNKILIDENNIWLGTKGQGIIIFNKKTRKHFIINETKKLIDNTILSFTKYNKTQILVGTNTGINSINKKNFQVTIPSFLENDNIGFATAILTQKNSIWIGTNGYGLISIQKKDNGYIRQNFIQNDFNSYSISSNIINSISTDNSGSIWVGTQDGISYFDPVKQFFGHYNYQFGNSNSLLDKNVWSIYEDDTVIWVGSREGITSVNPKTLTYQQYPYKGLDANNNIYALEKDSYNRLWAGTSDGLFIFDPINSSYTKVPYRDINTSQQDNRVNHIYLDRENNLWAACNEGLARVTLDSLKYQFYSSKDTGRYQLPNYECKTVIIDKKNILWIGLIGGGICKGVRDASNKYLYQFVSHFNEGEDTLSISNNTVLSVLEGEDDEIWIGTYGGGLNHLNTKNEFFKTYTEEDGLANNAIYGLLKEKDSNKIWVSTNFGLSRFDYVNKTFQNFSENDGLQSNEFNSGAYHRGKSGKLYFGGINGLNVFDPNKVIQNKVPPKIVISDILLFNDPIAKVVDSIGTTTHLKTLKLRYKQNNVTFRFSALHFTHSKGNRYRIMMEGLYEEPLDLGDLQQVNYANLSPGNYTFKVWAANSDGVWTKEPTELKIIITPPFWKTWWFVTILTFFTLLVFYISYIIRIRSMKSQKRKLTFLVEKRTKTITKQKEQIEKQKQELEIEKNKADELLLNILPAETAEELKNKGKARTRYYRMVTVMFTDIKGFTKIAETMKPIDLVKQLDLLFKDFDQVIEKHQIEKIKTIGDAYMAAGGVPLRDKENPVNSVLAALEIQSHMKIIQQKMKAEGGKHWELRIGLHTGDVIAGVIGTKRIAYDIWGNTVNVAQRMEMSGVPGKVNISGTTYDQIKPYFDCTYRGKIAAKNKGEIDMYFVDRIKPHLSKDEEGTIPNQKFKDYVNLHIYSSINYRKAERHIMRLLEKKLSPSLFYHGIHHTLDVVDSIERIAIMEGVLDEDIFVLKSAATYHDAGFVEQYDANEPVGARMATEILPKYGYTPEQVKQVEALIYATRIPHKPNNLLEQIICDADLDYLGRDDFFEISDTLRRELREHGKIDSDRTWDEIQVKFLNMHKYFTDSAIKLRQADKLKHLEIIKQRLIDNNYKD